MSQEPVPNFIRHLKERSFLLQRAREFFTSRNLLEVDCGSLVKRAPLDRGVDVISAQISKQETAFLHTSPEYAMKKWLSFGAKDIFFLGHVYRQGEQGPLHSPEFTMAEWYRIGFTLDQMIQETAEFLFLFLKPLPIRHLSYKDAFKQYLNIDNIKKDLSSSIPSYGKSWPHNVQLDYLITHHIQPFLGQNELTVLKDYPPDQAALACLIEKDQELVAERFEIYHQGVELTNGYHELSDPEELEKRFALENEERRARNEEPYLIDEELILALKRGLPDCCGVSVGFDRALMLRQKASSLSHILP